MRLLAHPLATISRSPALSLLAVLALMAAAAAPVSAQCRATGAAGFNEWVSPTLGAALSVEPPALTVFQEESEDRSEKVFWVSFLGSTIGIAAGIGMGVLITTDGSPEGDVAGGFAGILIGSTLGAAIGADMADGPQQTISKRILVSTLAGVGWIAIAAGADSPGLALALPVAQAAIMALFSY